VKEVRAAGGVVVRQGSDRTEVLLVHRPRYDDWTLPKGKAAPEEADEACAVREVEEETGLRCSVGRELTSVSYIDARGREKHVRYWLMAPISGSFRPTAEVDRARWLEYSAAHDLLTYARDRNVLQDLREKGGI